MATTAFPVNPTLTAIAIGYKNRDIDLIADQVLPRIGKSGKKFSYTKYSAADAYTVPDTKVGRKSEPTVVDFGGTLVTDECVDWGLDDIIPNDEMLAWESQTPGAGTGVSPQAKSTSLLAGLIQLDREIRVANLIFSAATYPAGNSVTLSGTAQWSDPNSDPLAALTSALDGMLFRPNTLVFGQSAWTRFRQHPKIVQAANGTNQTAGMVSRQAVADLLEVKQILVGAGFANTARKGQTPVLSRVWGKHVAALYVSEDAASADQPTFGFTAEYGTVISGEIAEPRMGLRGSLRVRVGESVKEVITAPDVGYLFVNAVT